MSIIDLVNDDIARTQSAWYEHGIHRLEETVRNAEVNADTQQGASRSGPSMQTAVTLGELREIDRTVRSASGALLDPTRSEEAVSALELARDVLEVAKQEWNEFQRGKWTSISGPSDRRVEAFARGVGEALHRISDLLSAIELESQKRSDPRNVVTGVLATLFGEDAASSVRFTTAADGVTQLVDLTSLPHEDPGWHTGESIQFQTLSGKKPMEEVNELIRQAQADAGIENRIETTILVLE